MRHHSSPARLAATTDKKNAEIQYERQDVAEYVERNLAIGKVMSILTCCQLMASAACAFTEISPAAQQFFYENAWIGWLALLLSTQITIFLDVFPLVRARVPYNIGLVAVLTVTQAVIMAMITSNTDSAAPLIMMTITCVSTGTIAIIALFAIFDMTFYLTHIAVCIYVLCCIQFGMLIVCPHFCPYVPVYDRAVGGLAAFVYCAYNGGVIQMIADQLMFEKSGEVEGYTRSVLILHPDIVNVATNILRMIVGTAARKDMQRRRTWVEVTRL